MLSKRTLLTLLFLPFFGKTSAAWNETAKLVPDDGFSGDAFGKAVAIYEDTMVAGALGDDDNGLSSGSAYIYRRDGIGNWVEQLKLLPDDGEAVDRFGEAVAIHKNTVVVSAPFDDDNGDGSGSVHIYRRATPDSDWFLDAKVTPSGLEADDRFGQAVAVWEDTVLVGATRDDDFGPDAGAVFVLERDDDGNWLTTAKVGSEDGWFLGRSVALYEDAFVAGSSSRTHPAGDAYVFGRAGGSTWVLEAKLEGRDINAIMFASTVAIHEDTVVVGQEDWDFTRDHPIIRSAVVFTKDGESWSKEAKLEAFFFDPPEGGFTRYGVAVTLHGDVLAVDDQSFESKTGKVRIYKRVDGTWSHEADVTASDRADGDRFGSALALYEGTLVVGAVLDDDKGSSSGSLYVFEAETEDTPCRDITIDFDEFETGSVPFDLGYGVTVKGDSKRTRSEGVMIFDTANPTGEDTDLASDTLGKVLILTEDGDASDPDDNALGGVIKFFFDPPIAKVVSLDLLDFDAAGSKIAGNYADPDADDMKPKKIPATRDGEEQTVVVDEESISKLRVVIEGSGAIAALHLLYCPPQ